MAMNLQLLAAVRLGQAAEVQRLIAEGADVSVREDAKGDLPLHLAAGRARGGGDHAAGRGGGLGGHQQQGLTALHLASMELVRVLLDAGAAHRAGRKGRAWARKLNCSSCAQLEDATEAHARSGASARMRQCCSGF
ncbi:hypothetical protein T484DRAFT_1911042 [Baffinella frigidus]|nr:hypothetical protein T484DRAFT_1911042 [Cryptophyta sp. CCMP2293]